MKKRIHLVCNAHIDPVWLWTWEDGLAETLSTFRIAADFCEANEGFVFNHNEALLYRWVEQYEPALFQRIQRLVRDGRWHISGGAYLQPDVNCTSGESHIRQFLVAREYFLEKFGVVPTVAYNFDPFGHAEGLPQILKGCGMDGYVFCRPDYGTYDLPVGMFEWKDRSGTSLLTRRSDDHYESTAGIIPKLDKWLAHYADEPETMILWGIGNHGGGPSRRMYAELQQYMIDHPEYEWIHSTPEKFFAARRNSGESFPAVTGEIQNSFPGCYTSMSRVKRAHRAAESLMASTERLATLAWWLGIAPFPKDEIDTAWRDILFSEFHDILPGSCIPSAEADSLQLLAHCMERLKRTRLRTLLTILRNEPAAAEGTVPIFVVNPHGFAVKTQIEFEVVLAHRARDCRNPVVTLRANGRKIPSQRLTAEAVCAEDWRVRLCAEVKLQPWEILRIDESYKSAKEPTPYESWPTSRENLAFSTPRYDLRIDPKTGLICHLSLPRKQESLLKPNSFQPVLFDDFDHSWTCGDPSKHASPDVGTTAKGWDKPTATFRLATADEAAAISPNGIDKWTKPTRTSVRALRIIEHGPLRTVVEAILICGPSVVVRQYHIGHRDGLLELRDRILFNHKDRMLKLLVPLAFTAEQSHSEALYSVATREPTQSHDDRPNQRWVAVTGNLGSSPACLTITNTGSYAHSLTPKELALNILRSPAYSSFNIRPEKVSKNHRFLPRQDQGEHLTSFQIHIAPKFYESRITQAAAIHNIPLWSQVYFPPGCPAESPLPALPGTITVDNPNVHIVALKQSESQRTLTLRLFNASAVPQSFNLKFRLSVSKISLPPAALATYTLDPMNQHPPSLANAVEVPDAVQQPKPS